MKYDDFNSNTGNRASESTGSYEKISPTAWLIAYERALSDIPLSKEIFRELEEVIKQSQYASEYSAIEELRNPRASFIWESRYKIVNHLIEQERIDQVLEIASGYSPRGLNMAKDPSVEYVEIDLHGVMEVKKRIVEKLVSRSEVPLEPNLRLEEGNALDIQDLLTATHTFKVKPIIIANEGLLQYLNLDEKRTLGGNVHQLLGRFGGVWITPDIATQTQVSLISKQTQVSLFKDRPKKRAIKIQNITGIDMMNNLFESEEAARSFFESLGFVVEQHSFIEVADELVLPQRFKLAKEQIDKILGRFVAFVMKVNTTG